MNLTQLQSLNINKALKINIEATYHYWLYLLISSLQRTNPSLPYNLVFFLLPYRIQHIPYLHYHTYFPLVS